MDSSPAPRNVGATATLALALAAIAGFVDAVGFVVLRGLFTAHMSGNAAQVGVRLGHGDPAAAVPLIVAVVLFVCGVALGASVDGIVKRMGMTPRTSFVIGLQVILVAAFMAYGEVKIGGGRVADHG